MIRTTPSADPAAAPATPHADPLHVLWVGDATLAKRYVARRAPHVHITASDGAGALDLLATQKPPADRTLDLVVIDAAAPAANALQVLSVAGAEGINLPAILLTPPGEDDWLTRAGRLAVCDTLVQTQDFLHQLLATIAQVRLRHDVTVKLEKARRHEQHLKTILETQPVAVCTIDGDGTVATINRAGSVVFGARPEDVVGARLDVFLADEEHPLIAGAIDSARSGEPAAARHLLRRADGSLREVHTEFAAFPGTGGSALILTIHDWSDRRSDREVSELSERINALRTEADAARQEVVAQRDDARRRADAAEARCAKEEADRERQTTAMEILLTEAQENLAAARAECGRLQQALDAAQAAAPESDAAAGAEVSERVNGDTAGAATPLERAGDSAQEQLALQLQAAEARCLALTEAVAQLAAQAQTARVSEADATAIFASRCRQLSEELTEARTALGASDGERQRLASELNDVRQSITEDTDRSLHLSEELARLQDALAAADERGKRAQEAEVQCRAQAEALARQLADDRRAFAGMRQALLRLLTDAEGVDGSDEGHTGTTEDAGDAAIA